MTANASAITEPARSSRLGDQMRREVTRLFCHITENWRGRPLVDHETVVQLIGSVRTTAGLTVTARLDKRQYATGIKVSDAQMEDLLITHEPFHGEWNYTLHPRQYAAS
jgi:hypothetical protein